MSKCAFFLSAVRFLGHIVDGEGMTPDRDKVKVLADMPAPVTIGDVRERVQSTARPLSGPMLERIEDDVIEVIGDLHDHLPPSEVRT